MMQAGKARGWLLLALTTVVIIFSASAEVEAREYADIYMDVTRESMEKADVGAVVFPHWFHRIRYKCKVCHEKIFVMRKGGNNISMQEIMDGKACGVCHNGQIAWEPLECKRCHSAELTPAAGNTAKVTGQLEGDR